MGDGNLHLNVSSPGGYHAGLLSLVEERDLTPQTLATAVDDAVACPTGRRDKSPIIDLDGADTTAKILIELMEGSGNGLVE